MQRYPSPPCPTRQLRCHFEDDLLLPRLYPCFGRTPPIWRMPSIQYNIVQCERERNTRSIKHKRHSSCKGERPKSSIIHFPSKCVRKYSIILTLPRRATKCIVLSPNRLHARTLVPDSANCSKEAKFSVLMRFTNLTSYALTSSSVGV